MLSGISFYKKARVSFWPLTETTTLTKNWGRQIRITRQIPGDVSARFELSLMDGALHPRAQLLGHGPGGEVQGAGEPGGASAPAEQGHALPLPLAHDLRRRDQRTGAKAPSKLLTRARISLYSGFKAVSVT